MGLQIGLANCWLEYNPEDKWGKGRVGDKYFNKINN